jgi:hypothetical protein
LAAARRPGVGRQSSGGCRAQGYAGAAGPVQPGRVPMPAIGRRIVAAA